MLRGTISRLLIIGEGLSSAKIHAVLILKTLIDALQLPRQSNVCMVLNVKIYAPGMNELNPLQIQGYGVGYHHDGVIHFCSTS